MRPASSFKASKATPRYTSGGLAQSQPTNFLRSFFMKSFTALLPSAALFTPLAALERNNAHDHGSAAPQQLQLNAGKRDTDAPLRQAMAAVHQSVTADSARRPRGQGHSSQLRCLLARPLTSRSPTWWKLQTARRCRRAVAHHRGRADGRSGGRPRQAWRQSNALLVWCGWPRPPMPTASTSSHRRLESGCAAALRSK